MLTDINSLTGDELKKFENFINSPYFNRYRTIKKLFHYLKSFHPNVTPKDIYEKNISRAVFKHRTQSGDWVRGVYNHANHAIL